MRKTVILEERRTQLDTARLQSQEVREKRLFGSADIVTEYIAEHPGRNLTEIARAMKWSIGKAQRILNFSEKELGNINSLYKLENGINKRFFYLIPWYNQMDWQNFDDNEATQLMVEQVASLQQEAYNKGIEIMITDPILRNKLNLLMQTRIATTL